MPVVQRFTLREARKFFTNYKIYEAAKKLGIKQRSLMDYEKNNQYPAEEMISKICELYGVQRGQLIVKSKEDIQKSKEAEKISEKICKLINEKLYTDCLFICRRKKSVIAIKFPEGNNVLVTRNKGEINLFDAANAAINKFKEKEKENGE